MTQLKGCNVIVWVRSFCMRVGTADSSNAFLSAIFTQKQNK